MIETSVQRNARVSLDEPWERQTFNVAHGETSRLPEDVIPFEEENYAETAKITLGTKPLQTFAEPIFPSGSGLSAQRIREFSRKITKRIPRRERENFIEERNELVTKKFKAGLSRKEERRLALVRWQLDRIDDADHGATLDFMEKIAEDYMTFAHDLDRILEQLEPRGHRRRR
jgi:hypothetical protein